MRSIEDLLDALVKATEDDKLAWQKEAYGHRFVAAISKEFEIKVWEWTEEDSEVSGVTATLNRGEQMIDRIVVNEFGPMYPKVYRLFEAARRSANNIDQVIGEVEGALKSLTRRK